MSAYSETVLVFEKQMLISPQGTLNIDKYMRSENIVVYSTRICGIFKTWKKKKMFTLSMKQRVNTVEKSLCALYFSPIHRTRGYDLAVSKDVQYDWENKRE